MMMTQELLDAAQTLGEALHASPAVQALKEIEAAIAADSALMRDLAELNHTYEDMLVRRDAGDRLTQGEINWFTSLQERVYNHPLMVEREQRRQAVQALFEWAGASINSIISVDFIALVGVE